MDGNTVINNIIRYANAVNLGVSTTTTNNIRTNFTIASTAQNISTFTAFGGLNASYTSNSVSGTVDGFSHVAQNNTYSDPNNIVELVISNDLDYYNGSSTAYQGFYKTASIKANAKNIATNYTATSDKYTLQLKQEVLSGATVTTNQIDFYIDDLNNSPALDNVLIDTITVSNTNQYTYISGVLTILSGATFNTQVNIEHLGHYFLRNDKKHLDLTIKRNGGTGNAVSSTLNVLRDDFTLAGNKYYISPASGTGYQTSTTLYNTDGYTLDTTTTRGRIQIRNSVSVNSNINNIFDEDLQLSATPYNLYGSGAVSVRGIIDTTTGTSKGSIRADTLSNTTKNNLTTSSTNYGEHVRSGIDTSTTFYPSGPSTNNNDFGDTYDHTKDISSIKSKI